MAYHDEDLIDLDVFDMHDNDGQFSIHSIDAADQRPSAQQSPQFQVQTLAVVIDVPNSPQAVEDDPLPEAPETVSVSKKRDASSSTHRGSVDQVFNWGNPILMVMFLLIGISLAVAHHFYYLWLDGRVVGDSNKQQWALR